MFKYVHLLPTLPPEHSKGLKITVLSGNEALAKASLSAGMTFSASRNKFEFNPPQSPLSEEIKICSLGLLIWVSVWTKSG